MIVAARSTLARFDAGPSTKAFVRALHEAPLHDRSLKEIPPLMRTGGLCLQGRTPFPPFRGFAPSREKFPRELLFIFVTRRREAAKKREREERD